jgi:pyruvate kinase
VHGDVIRRIRRAAEKTGRPVAIMADLPGPKIRIGTLLIEPVELVIGQRFTLTTVEVMGTRDLVSVTLKELPHAVRPGDVLFINDGLIQVQVETLTVFGCTAGGGGGKPAFQKRVESAGD